MTLTDEQWRIIEKLLVNLGEDQNFKRFKQGRPKASDRVALEGVLWVLLNGEQWSHLPKSYGAYVTVWRRYREWVESGLWSKIWSRLLETFDKKTEIEWTMAFLEGKFVPGKRS